MFQSLDSSERRQHTCCPTVLDFWWRVRSVLVGKSDRCTGCRSWLWSSPSLSVPPSAFDVRMSTPSLLNIASHCPTNSRMTPFRISLRSSFTIVLLPPPSSSWIDSSSVIVTGGTRTVIDFTSATLFKDAFRSFLFRMTRLFQPSLPLISTFSPEEAQASAPPGPSVSIDIVDVPFRTSANSFCRRRS